MNIDQGMYFLWYNLTSKRILGCVTIWILVFVLFYFVGQIYEGFNTQWMFNPMNPFSFVITSVTSTFLHLTFDHLFNNMVWFVIFGSIFFTILGARKGSSYIILLIFILHIVEWIIFIVLKILFSFLKQQYMEVHNIQDWSFEIFPLKGLGASGIITGIMGFVIVALLMFEGKKELLQGVKAIEISTPQLVYILILTIGLIMLLLTFTRDLTNFLAIYGKYFQIVLFNKIYLDFDFLEGNPYFSHLLEAIIGSFLGYKDSQTVKDTLTS